MSDANYREHRVRTSLTQHVGKTAISDAELRALAEQAWLQRGVIVLMPTQVLNWQDRKLIEAVATRLYGKRRGA